MSKTRTQSPAAVADALAAQAPADWKAVRGAGWTDGAGAVQDDGFGAEVAHVVFSKSDIVVALNLSAIQDNRWERERAFNGCTVEGHTLLNGGSFTRRGIDMSSCALVADAAQRSDNEAGDLLALLASQEARCAAVVARRATAESVPGLPFTRQPEWFAETSKALAAGRSVRLTPHGMGTGYMLHRGIPKAGRSYGQRRAVPALEQRLNVGPLTVEEFDHD